MSPKSVFVLAIDPGCVTGWAIFEVEFRALVNLEVNVLSGILWWDKGSILTGSVNRGKEKGPDKSGVGGIDTVREHECVDRLMGMVDVAKSGQWAFPIEDFIVRRLDPSRDYISPLRITSCLEDRLYVRGKRLVRISTADAGGTMDDDRLKALGFYDRKSGTDARSATRVGLVFLRRCKDLARGRALVSECWPEMA